MGYMVNSQSTVFCLGIGVKIIHVHTLANEIKIFSMRILLVLPRLSTGICTTVKRFDGHIYLCYRYSWEIQTKQNLKFRLRYFRKIEDYFWRSSFENGLYIKALNYLLFDSENKYLITFHQFWNDPQKSYKTQMERVQYS